MLKLFEFLFQTLPLILACLYAIVSILILVVHIKLYKNKKKLSIEQWIIVLLNVSYALLFLITLIFFFELWKGIFSILGLVAILISFIWSKYEDKRKGRRWWNW
jgi:hypothetical protein